jgi:hypothetical protein
MARREVNFDGGETLKGKPINLALRRLYDFYGN